MKKCWKLLLVLTLALLTAIPVLAAETQLSAAGWVKEGGNTFYYRKGKQVTGWQKISGKYYYFDDGILEKNTIAGSKKEGYYYVDQNGVRITDKQIAMAVKFVLKHSRMNDTPRDRLRDCYDVLRNYRYQRIYRNNPSAGMVPSYASYMFTHRRGNCYRYASAYAYIARVLGFKVRVCAGGVNTRNGRYLSPHGWCEVKIGDTWKMVDCSLGRHHWRHNFFLTTREKYPFHARCNKIFTMKIKNHKIHWTTKRDGWHK